MIQVSRVFHAGYIFTASDGTRVLFDPIFESPFATNCYPFPATTIDHAELAKDHFDAVFISHHHDDHFSLLSLDRLDRKTPIYLYCRTPEPFDFLRELGFESVHSLELNVAVTIGSFEITPRPSVNREVDALFEIESGNLRILNCVDAWIEDTTVAELSQRKWDLVLWPFQTLLETDIICPQFALPADQTLPQEWLTQIEVLSPRFVVPSSCQFLHEAGSWVNSAHFPITYVEFAREVSALGATVVKLDPGVEADLTEQGFVLRGRVPWVRSVQQSTNTTGSEYDYVYDANVIAPPTSEVAQRFGSVTEDEWMTLIQFIRAELPIRFSELRESSEDYFSKSRVWSLTLHDPIHGAIEFKFDIDGRQMIESSKTFSRNALPEWRSEIIASKLLSCLNDGESLTSLYLRVNDGDFSNECLDELKWVDVLADPLIRCLYEKDTHAFQRAQLKKLLRSRT